MHWNKQTKKFARKDLKRHSIHITHVSNELNQPSIFYILSGWGRGKRTPIFFLRTNITKARAITLGCFTGNQFWTCFLLLFLNTALTFSWLNAVTTKALPIMHILKKATIPNDSHKHRLRISLPAWCLGAPHSKSRTWKTMKMPQQQRKATANNKEIKNIFRKSL